MPFGLKQTIILWLYITKQWGLLGEDYCSRSVRWMSIAEVVYTEVTMVTLNRWHQGVHWTITAAYCLAQDRKSWNDIIRRVTTDQSDNNAQFQITVLVCFGSVWFWLVTVLLIAQFQITDFFRLFSVQFCTVRLGYVFIYCLNIGCIVSFS